MAEQVKITITASDQTKQGIQSVEVNLKKMADQARGSLERIAVGAGIASAAILTLSKHALDAYAEMERNLKSLDAVERGFMGTTGTLTQKAKELQDQFFGLSATSGALRDLITGGLGISEATKLVEVFKDRAILLGSATIPLEERLLNLAQAFKTEQSRLGDLSGLTDNFAQIVERGSQIVGKNADEMTKSERAHAKYAAIVELSAPFIGKAGELTESLTGKQAALSTEVTKTEQTIGAALAPAYKALLGLITPVVEGSRKWIEQNPSLVMGLTSVAAGATAAASAISAIGAAILAMRLVANPITGIVAAISAAVGAFAGLVLSTKAAQDQENALNGETASLMRQYEGLRKMLDDATASSDKKKLAATRLKEVLSRLFELQPQMKNWFDAEGKLLDGATAKWNQYRDAVVNAKRVELVQNITGAEKTLSDLKRDRAGIADKTRAKLEPELKVAEQSMGFIAPENLAGHESRIAQYKGMIEDQVALATADLDRKIALAEANLGRDRALLGALNEPLKPEDVLPPRPDGGTGDGGSGGKADPFKDALRYVDHLKAMDRLTIAQEIAMLNEVKAAHAKKADEVMEIDERIHKAEKEAGEKAKEADKERADAAVKLLDHRIRMNQAGTKEEILEIQRILTAYTLSDEQKQTLQERLADAQQKLAREVADEITDQQAKDAATEEERVRAKVGYINHLQRLGRLSKEQEIADLQQLLQDESGYYQRHADERYSIDERVYSLRDDLRQADLKREKDAQSDALNAVKSARSQVLEVISRAEKDVLNAIKARQKADTDVLEQRIAGKERELQLYERQLAAEDRLKKIAEAKQRIADLQRTGEREMVLLANGQFEERIRGMGEAQKALADAEEEDRRAKRKEDLQDQVGALRTQLANLKDAQAQELAAHQTFWDNVKNATDNGFDTLEKTQGGRISGLTSQLSTLLTGMLGPWQGYASEVARIMRTIGAVPAPPGESGGGGSGVSASGGGKLLRLGEGAYLPGGDPFPAIVNDSEETMLPHKYLGGVASRIAELIMPRMQALTMPMMPTMSPMGGGGASFGPVSISVQVSGAAAQTPEGIGQAVASGVEQGMESAFRRNWALGIVRK